MRTVHIPRRDHTGEIQSRNFNATKRKKFAAKVCRNLIDLRNNMNWHLCNSFELGSPADRIFSVMYDLEIVQYRMVDNVLKERFNRDRKKYGYG